ncbi:MAG: alkaline phosphatase family protein [Sediminibacterium sp.]
MKRTIVATCLGLLSFTSFAQKPLKPIPEQGIKHPKLVVGIVVDQMRWDYLYRFYDLYKANGGFKRLLGKGFTCDNTSVPYLPTVTACGHTCVYTGSVPAVHGITGNNWWDNNLQRTVYCTEDKTVQGVGSSNTGDAGQMSPNNVFVTTITDELRLSTNFRSKVIGLSIKDRGSIIPAGHAANAAYWYDNKSGNFITSTYYMKTLPAWMQQFNERRLVDSFYDKNWNRALPEEIYKEYCDADENAYESKPFGSSAVAMPYDLKQFRGKDFSKIASTPFGNDLLLELVKSTLQAEQMGEHEVTDFLAVSFSSTDYVGHAFGPNSWEVLDTYVRLDETLGNLFDYLDQTIGRGQYTTFLTADHAGAHIPGFLKKRHLPGGHWEDGEIKKELADHLKQQYNQANLINAVMEYDIYLNHRLIDSAKMDEQAIKHSITQYLLQNEMILQIVDKKQAATAPVPARLRDMLVNSYNPQRSGDLQIIMKSGVLDGGKTGMSHGVWNAYDTHIPLVWYGWGIKQGSMNKETYMTDIAPTLAALLHIQMPSGAVGKVIGEVIK